MWATRPWWLNSRVPRWSARGFELERETIDRPHLNRAEVQPGIAIIIFQRAKRENNNRKRGTREDAVVSHRLIYGTPHFAGVMFQDSKSLTRKSVE